MKGLDEVNLLLMEGFTRPVWYIVLRKNNSNSSNNYETMTASTQLAIQKIQVFYDSALFPSRTFSSILEIIFLQLLFSLASHSIH